MLASSGSGADVKQAIDLAYLHGKQHGIFSSVQETFPKSYGAYTIDQYEAFISKNRIGKPWFFT